MRRVAWVLGLVACGGDGKGQGDGIGDDDDDDTFVGDDDDDDVVAPPGDLFSGTVCTEGGWCWETPQPAGGLLQGIWAVGPDDVWSTSQTHLFHYDGDEVRSAAFPTLVPYGGVAPVFGLRSDDVWAHGFNGFVHWDGVSWTESTAGTYATSLHGHSDVDLWAVGFGGIYRGDGVAWTLLRSDPGVSYVDVWASGPDEAVIGGYDGVGGTVWLVEGDRLTDLDFPGAAYAVVGGVYAPSADDVWAVGGDGAWQLSGGAWTQRSTDWSLVDVWGSGPDDVWMLSMTRTVYHWDGASLTSDTLPPGLYATHITGAGDQVWVSDSSGALYRNDGAGWSSIKAPLSVGTVSDLVGAADGTAFASAGEEVLFRDALGNWSVTADPGAPLAGLGDAAGETLAFTTSGTWKWSGSDWRITLDGDGLLDACTLDDGTVLGVGDHLATFDGLRWQPEPLDVSLPIGRVICVGDEAFATSLEDYDLLEEPTELLRYDADGWRHVGLRTAIDRTVAAAFAPDADAAFVVILDESTNNRMLMRFDGTGWEEVPLEFAPFGVGGRDADDVWVVGGGELARITPSGIEPVTGGPGADFRWVRVDGQGVATLVATDGAVWTCDPAGPTWTREQAGSSIELEDVAFSGGDVFGIAYLWNAVRLERTGWTSLNGSWEQVEASDDAGVWFVDVGSRLGEWDGATIVEDWDSVPGQVFLPTNGPDLLAIDYDGELHRRTGSSWTLESSASVQSPTLAFGASIDDLWVLGEDEADWYPAVDRRSAGAWERWDELVQPVAFGVSPTNEEIWIDGSQAIWRRNGAGFENLFPPGALGSSYAITGAVVRDYDDVWVTAFGAVLRFDGAWSSLGEPVGLGFYGMSTTPDGTGFALGQTGWVASLEP